jgi:tryptophan synthase alpha chain
MKKEFIPFLMAGDPNLATTERIARALIAEGVRTLELGVPFSDPLADGPTLQRSAARGLAAGTRLVGIFELCHRLTQDQKDLQIVLFSYLNPLLRYGLERYVTDAKKNGVTATLAVDLTPEESSDYVAAHRKHGLGTVFLASPTTTPERFKTIAELSSPFIYYVSRTGVTGERSELSLSLQSEVERLRRLTDKPIAIGFGISTPMQVHAVAATGNSVVVGSKLVGLIEEAASVDAAEQDVRDFVKECLSCL